MNNLYVSEKESYIKSLKETMAKFGFVYSDVGLFRARHKADKYNLQGFKAEVQHRATGYYVVLNL